jgi:2-aminoethylphosphonate-pyruvate transaminase
MTVFSIINVDMTKTNQFRFTPPTHVLVAFEQALQEFKAEGGIDARHNKYGSLQK